LFCLSKRIEKKTFHLISSSSTKSGHEPSNSTIYNQLDLTQPPPPLNYDIRVVTSKKRNPLVLWPLRSRKRRRQGRKRKIGSSKAGAACSMLLVKAKTTRPCSQSWREDAYAPNCQSYAKPWTAGCKSTIAFCSHAFWRIPCSRRAYLSS